MWYVVKATGVGLGLILLLVGVVVLCCGTILGLFWTMGQAGLWPWLGWGAAGLVALWCCYKLGHDYLEFDENDHDNDASLGG